MEETYTPSTKKKKQTIKVVNPYEHRILRGQLVEHGPTTVHEMLQTCPAVHFPDKYSMDRIAQLAAENKLPEHVF